MQYRNPEGRVARWLGILSSFEMKIVYRPGQSHRNADGTSRIDLNCVGCILRYKLMSREENHHR